MNPEDPEELVYLGDPGTPSATGDVYPEILPGVSPDEAMAGITAMLILDANQKEQS